MWRCGRARAADNRITYRMAKKRTVLPRKVPSEGRHALREELVLSGRIYEVLLKESALSAEEAEEAAFHMTDWFDDLQALVRLYRSSRWNSKRAYEILQGFIIHAPRPSRGCAPDRDALSGHGRLRDRGREREWAGEAESGRAVPGSSEAKQTH